MNYDALTVEGLHKSFGETRALDGMSWTAPAGQVTALLGPNGAGKTTALRCIAGILRPDQGEVTILGRPAREHGTGESISFLPEQPELYPALTVYEHLRFIALAYHMDGSWEGKAEELFGRFELTELVDDVPSELSQGQRRKTALVAALLHGARVLLFDEPFNGLDPRAASELRSLLVDLAAGGATVVISTHVLAAAERFVDRAVIVDRGQAVAEGSMPDLRSAAGADDEADLEEVFLLLTGRQLAEDPVGEVVDDPGVAR